MGGKGAKQSRKRQDKRVARVKQHDKRLAYMNGLKDLKQSVHLRKKTHSEKTKGLFSLKESKLTGARTRWH